MAKRRRQTTGQPRRRRAPDAAGDAGSREYESRAERESRIQRWVLVGTGITIALVVLILLGAVVLELFVTPNTVAANVADETISIAAFQERVRLERAILNTRVSNYVSLLAASGLDANQFVGQEPLRGWLAQINDSNQLGSGVLDVMIEDVLVRQEAEARGLAVGQEEIDEQINRFLGLETPTGAEDVEPDPLPTALPAATRTPFVSPTPREQLEASPTATVADPTATATATDETAEITPTFTPVPATATLTVAELESRQGELRDSILGDLAASARIGEERLHAYFEALALREALVAELFDSGAALPFVNARHILVAEESEALDLLTALREGESFAALASANSLDAASGRNGGELGWAPASNYVRPFAEAMLNASPGELVGPVASEFGWHVIQLRAREERNAGASQLETARNSTLVHWLEDRRAALAESIEILPVWADNVPDEPVLLLTGQG